MITPQSPGMLSASHGHACTFIKSQNYNGQKLEHLVLVYLVAS